MRTGCPEFAAAAQNDCYNATIAVLLAFVVVMNGDAHIRAKLRELADALGRLSQHVPGEDGAELRRCARDVALGTASLAPTAAPGPGRPPRLN
jgi:hypothetical protein